MMPEEKSQLLALLAHSGKWCRQAEARDANGDPVRFDDDTAVAWDITGAMCRLFGLQRACALFVQLDRHLNGKRPVVGWPARDPEMDAMGALQEFNDQTNMTFDIVRGRMETIPVWRGNARQIGAASGPESVASTPT